MSSTAFRFTFALVPLDGLEYAEQVTTPDEHYFADLSARYADRAHSYYKPYRKPLHAGYVRAWTAAKVDHRADPLVPAMKPLNYVQRDGAWADKSRVLEPNRWSLSRQRWVLSERKERRLKARQRDKHLRHRYREQGW